MSVGGLQQSEFHIGRRLAEQITRIGNAIERRRRCRIRGATLADDRRAGDRIDRLELVGARRSPRHRPRRAVFRQRQRSSRRCGKLGHTCGQRLRCVHIHTDDMHDLPGVTDLDLAIHRPAHRPFVSHDGGEVLRHERMALRRALHVADLIDARYEVRPLDLTGDDPLDLDVGVEADLEQLDRLGADHPFDHAAGFANPAHVERSHRPHRDASRSVSNLAVAAAESRDRWVG